MVGQFNVSLLEIIGLILFLIVGAIWGAFVLGILFYHITIVQILLYSFIKWTIWIIRNRK